ncbi:MAG: hypothetical protein RL662_414 [Bacteroidota bacterium]|jgi:O-antigen/teichoic acid export membrane protein
MAGGMKSLAKDTAIYGLSSILGKFVNWCLVPIYTQVLATGEFGVMTNIYSFTALVAVILTFGMETGFFRFANKGQHSPTQVYSTSLLFVGAMSLTFVAICFLFLQPIATFLEYEANPDYIAMMVAVVAIDAFTSIPSAYLRYQKKPLRFAAVKLGGIFTTIFFTVFFLIVCPQLNETHPSLISWFYEPQYKVGYVFVANIIGSLVSLLILIPQFIGFRHTPNRDLLNQMLRYSYPLLILGIAGILNQTVDKILYPYLFEDKGYALEQLGIYSACSRLAIIMMMFTQAFRFAFEPFIFAKNKNESNNKAYTEAMKYFIIFSLIIFLGVMFYLDIIKYFIRNKQYYEGLDVVSIIMLGYILFGIYFNLSFWYKLIDKTYFGAIFSIIGCTITIVLNIVFVPQYGYMASAWASLICNLVMMLMSYYFERKYRPIPYDMKGIGLYFGLAVALYTTSSLVSIDNDWLRIGFRTILLGIFLAVVAKRDIALSEIPVLKKLIKKK